MAMLGGCYLGTHLQCIVLLVVASVVWLPVTGLTSVTVVVSFSPCSLDYKLVTKTHRPKFLADGRNRKAW